MAQNDLEGMIFAVPIFWEESQITVIFWVGAVYRHERILFLHYDNDEMRFFFTGQQVGALCYSDPELAVQSVQKCLKERE